MRIKKIKKGIKFQQTFFKDDYSGYYLGKVIYEDEEIDFGKIIQYTYLCGYPRMGRFLYDDKYIYECMAWDCISNVFDIENRCEVSPILELKRVRELYKKNNLKKKLR